jgi:RNA polymerase sigma-70 factor (ECF subfamily)
MARIQARDERALGDLYDRTSRIVYSLAMRILSDAADAEEVVCDVYAQVWRNAVAYDKSRGSLPGWLLLLTRSRALDRLRARGARRQEVALEMSASHPSRENTEETAAASERLRQVQEALGELAEDQCRLIQLAFFQGLSHTELARAVGLPLGTVKTRIRMGMMKLRSRLAVHRKPL